MRARSNKALAMMAERVGFEPTRRLPAYTRSRRAPSTTRPPLLHLVWSCPRVGDFRRSPAKTSALIDHSATSPSFVRQSVMCRSSVGNSGKPLAVQVSKDNKKANRPAGISIDRPKGHPRPFANHPLCPMIGVVGGGKMDAQAFLETSLQPSEKAERLADPGQSDDDGGGHDQGNHHQLTRRRGLLWPGIGPGGGGDVFRCHGRVSSRWAMSGSSAGGMGYSRSLCLRTQAMAWPSFGCTKPCHLRQI